MSVALMLEFLGEAGAALALASAVTRSAEDPSTPTRDDNGSARTREVGQAVCSLLAMTTSPGSSPLVRSRHPRASRRSPSGPARRSHEADSLRLRALRLLSACMLPVGRLPIVSVFSCSFPPPR